jgi:anoctamin-10
VIWPVTPLCAVLNDWLELRSDAVKLCVSQRRPVPHRGDSIGPWQMNIAFLSWLGTLTTSTLVYLFQGGDFNLKCDKTTLISLLVTILIAEHSYWVFDRALGTLSRYVWTTGEIDVRKEEYSMRRSYLQKLELSGGQGSTDSQAEKRRERALGDDPIGFWGEKNVDTAVAEGREILSRGWEKKKVQ